MKIKTAERAGLEFQVNFGGEGTPAPQYPEASIPGFTKIFQGYGSSRRVVVENTVSLAELEVLVSAMQDAGLDHVKLSIGGNLDKAKTYEPKPAAQAAA